MFFCENASNVNNVQAMVLVYKSRRKVNTMLFDNEEHKTLAPHLW